MSKRPNTLVWERPVPLDSFAEFPTVDGVVWQMQTRLVVRTKYLAEYVSVWRDINEEELDGLAAGVASDLGALHFRLAEPKESLAAEWVVLPRGVVDESVIRIQARRKGYSSD